eukprot:GFYU01001566.1.p1 GENE.GFYU01001566.1~~GFYU01001566.1.p1  ORF type:complete len:1172 (-),score=342.64 GFYU01001566.1:71-3586(-)
MDIGKSQYLVDVFAVLVGKQVLSILRDIGVLIVAVLTLAMPWRGLAMIVLLLENPTRFAKRGALRGLCTVDNVKRLMPRLHQRLREYKDSAEKTGQWGPESDKKLSTMTDTITQQFKFIVKLGAKDERGANLGSITDSFWKEYSSCLDVLMEMYQMTRRRVGQPVALSAASGAVSANVNTLGVVNVNRAGNEKRTKKKKHLKMHDMELARQHSAEMALEAIPSPLGIQPDLTFVEPQTAPGPVTEIAPTRLPAGGAEYKLTSKFTVENNVLSHYEAFNLNRVAAAEESMNAAVKQIEDLRNELQDDLKKDSFGPLGLFRRSRGETEKIIFAMLLEGLSDIVALLMLVVVVGTLYRIRTLKHGFKHNRSIPGLLGYKMVLMEQVVEIFLDIVALLQSLLIIATVRHSIDYLIHISEVMYPDADFEQARDLTNEYTERVVEDLWRFLDLFTYWKTYKMAMATLVWGAFTPSIVIYAFMDSDRLPKFLKVGVSLVIGLGLYVFPLIIHSNAGSTWTVGAVEGLLGFLLALLMISLVVAGRDSTITSHCGVVTSTTTIAGQSQHSFYIPPPVRRNWPNLLVIVTVLIEFWQLNAYVFRLPTPWPTDMQSSSRQAGQTIFFEGTDVREVMFIASCSVVALWFIISSLPISLERMLHWYSEGKLGENAFWRFLMTLLGNTLYFSVMMNLVMGVSCFKRNAGPEFDGCWEPNILTESDTVLAGLLCLVFYIPTAVVFAVSYRVTAASTTEDKDLHISEMHRMIMNTTKTVLAVTTVYWADASADHWSLLGVILSACLLLFLVTWQYRRLWPESTGLCSSRTLVTWMNASYVATAWTVVAVMVAHGVNDESYTAVIVLFAGWALIATCAALINHRLLAKYRALLVTRQERKAFGARVVAVIDSLEGPGKFYAAWDARGKKIQKRCKRRAAVAASSKSLSGAMLCLEDHLTPSALHVSFLALREVWRDTCEHARTAEEFERVVSLLEYSAAHASAPVSIASGVDGVHQWVGQNVALTLGQSVSVFPPRGSMPLGFMYEDVWITGDPTIATPATQARGPRLECNSMASCLHISYANQSSGALVVDLEYHNPYYTISATGHENDIYITASIFSVNESKSYTMKGQVAAPATQQSFGEGNVQRVRFTSIESTLPQGPCVLSIGGLHRSPYEILDMHLTLEAAP